MGQDADTAFAGIWRQTQMIASGEISSRELTQLYLDRCARLDPLLNAFRVVLPERALTEADQADARRAVGERRPLLGVPIAVKDEFDLAGEITALGSNAHGGPASQDSELVRRLRAAGAVIFGKTNVPELCLWPFTETAAFGYTRNPWDTQRTPGGSSGGSAAAVAAGLIGAAIGSDGGGSIRLPAAYCGLFGLKAQRGRLPLLPHQEHSEGLVVNGVLTRSVLDTALFHEALSDPVEGPVPDLLRAARAEGPDRSLRVGLAPDLPPSPLTHLHEHNRAALEETSELLRHLGHIVAPAPLGLGPLAPPAEFMVRYAHAASLDAAAMPHPERLERRTRGLARAGALLAGARGWARRREPLVSERLARALLDNDILLTPVTPAPPPPIGSCEGRGWAATSALASAAVSYLTSWNYTGQPACSVPAGLDPEGLPRAVQLVGRPGAEPTLLALAAQIESARPWAQERPPLFS